MKSSRGTQHTLRQIPRAVDERLRLNAREEGKSLNQTAVDVLTAGLALSGEDVPHHDLDYNLALLVRDAHFDHISQLTRV